MNDPNSVKTRLEQLHLDFLCRVLFLERFENVYDITGNNHTDLSTDDGNHAFELKSRTGPIQRITPHNNRIRPFTDTAYFESFYRADQKTVYEEQAENIGFSLNYIFSLALSNKQATEMDILEESIIERLIFILPWNINDIILRKNQRHIGPPILRQQKYDKFGIEKGSLFIETSLSDNLIPYFKKSFIPYYQQTNLLPSLLSLLQESQK